MSAEVLYRASYGFAQSALVRYSMFEVWAWLEKCLIPLGTCRDTAF